MFPNSAPRPMPPMPPPPPGPMPMFNSNPFGGQPSGGGQSFNIGDSQNVTHRRLIYITIIFVCEIIAFGLLMTLNNTNSIFLSNARGSAINPPNLLNTMAFCTGFSVVAAIIDLGSHFGRQPENRTREVGLAVITFLIFVGWLTLSSLLATNNPEKYYCGTGVFANGYCTASIRTIEGTTWAGTALFGVHALDSAFVAWGLSRM